MKKTVKKLLAVLLSLFLMLSFASVIVTANPAVAAEPVVDTEALNVAANPSALTGSAEHLEVFNEDGTMEMVEIPANASQASPVMPFASSSPPDFEKVQLYGSDFGELLITIMGDGFTEDQQSDFITAAQNVANFIVETRPFNDFKSSFNIQAIKVISEESGVQETKDGPPVNNYFGSKYYYDGNTERLLYVTNTDRVDELLPPGNIMCIILVNSTKWGGRRR